MGALLRDRPPDKESPAPLPGGDRDQSQLSRGNGDNNEPGGPPQARDRPLGLNYRLSDGAWLEALELPSPVRADHLEVRSRLLAEALRTGDWVSYSRHAAWWTKRRRYLSFGRRSVVAEIDFLAEHGLVENDRRRPGDRGWQSRFRATRATRLIARKEVPVHAPREVIVQRDDDGELVDYRDTTETWAMRRRGETLNEALAATVIDLAPGAPVARVGHVLQINEHLALSIDDRGLHRVFNRSSFKLGGRFYGGFWQSLKAKEDPEKPDQPVLRPYLTMNGEPTVELDYSGCHPRMLAAELGVDLGVDPYEIGGWQRDDVKNAVMVLINALDLGSALGRIAQDLGGYWEHHRAAQLIDAIKARHPRLASAFHSGAGLRLMRRDSDISDVIFARLLKRGIVALGVHDSYIVPAKNEADLRAEMVSAWRAQLGTNPVIK
jgi:hypothetical protein